MADCFADVEYCDCGLDDEWALLLLLGEEIRRIVRVIVLLPRE